MRHFPDRLVWLPVGADDAFVVDQPSGTVTLVFTDIEGSTRLLHELGQDGYRDALAEHRRVVRAAFGRHNGYEVDTEGDSFFYAFSSAADAVEAVVAAMAGLQDGPIRIRVGMHTGEPGLDAPKYVGLDVHLAARVMSVGHGGQVLLTRVTRDLLDSELLDLGEHRLKDITDPVWLYQLGETEFPPLRSLNNTNLPTPASSFMGRELELDEAGHLLAGCRLLTVSGPGGAGKTRFAIELAARQLPRFPNGVFWVPLAALRDPSLVTETIALTLGTRNGLAEHIGERQILLVLDNLEQVVTSAPELSQLLTQCPRLSLLVTSRELLRVQGEVGFALPPLATGEAVELFCERARCHPDPIIEQLSSRLEGLPLAIELAAARTSVFTPEQLLERLGQRLDLLQGGRDADPRQQTLRTTIQWSYDLLGMEEARLFRRLSVFAGGCTLEAAEEVADADPGTLQGLVEKSLVRRTDGRFWMLETIREFGLGELDRRGELAAARAGYFEWMRRLAEQAGGELIGPGLEGWLRRLHEEHANITEVVTLALDAADGELALGILTPLERYWVVRPGEAMGWFERGLAHLDQLPPELAADALRVAGMTAFFYGQPHLALERYRENLAISERLRDERRISLAYTWMALPLMDEGSVSEAAELLDKALEVHRRLGQLEPLGATLQLLSFLAAERGDLARAEELLEESIAAGRAIGYSQLVSRDLMILGDLKIETGELERGIDLNREALQISWSLRALMDVAMCFANLAHALDIQGDIRFAAILWGAAVRLDSELGPTQFRKEKPLYEASLSPTVFADEEGVTAGKALMTAEAVELALRVHSAATADGGRRGDLPPGRTNASVGER